MISEIFNDDNTEMRINVEINLKQFLLFFGHDIPLLRIQNNLGIFA